MNRKDGSRLGYNVNREIIRQLFQSVKIIQENKSGKLFTKHSIIVNDLINRIIDYQYIGIDNEIKSELRAKCLLVIYGNYYSYKRSDQIYYYLLKVISNHLKQINDYYDKYQKMIKELYELVNFTIGYESHYSYIDYAEYPKRTKLQLKRYNEGKIENESV